MAKDTLTHGKADAPVDWGDMSVEQLTDMIDHLLRIRQDREVHSEPGAAIASATGATGGSTVSSPSPVATITTTVTTPAQGSHQNTATTQTVIIPLIYREPTITPGHQPSATTPETPGTARPRVTLASRVHTNGWYCVARAREVGVIYDWYDVWPLVQGISPWYAKRFHTRERAQQAFDEKVVRGEVERVDD